MPPSEFEPFDMQDEFGSMLSFNNSFDDEFSHRELDIRYHMWKPLYIIRSLFICIVWHRKHKA